MGYKLKFRIIIIFLTVFYRVDLFAFECKVLEKTGSATFKKLDSDKYLKTVLLKFKKYQYASIKGCDIGEPLHEKGQSLLRARFFSKEMTVSIDSKHSILSKITIIKKIEKKSEFETEIEVYVRSKSEQKYSRLLYSIIDEKQLRPVLTLWYNHEKFLNEERNILISIRILDKYKKRNLLFIKYKDHGIAID